LEQKHCCFFFVAIGDHDDATESSGPAGMAVLGAMSVIANGFVYGLAGLGLGVAWYKIRGLPGL